MTIKKISTDKAPRAIGPYSQAISFKELVFVSGQIPIDPKTGKIEHQDIEKQTRQVLANISAILESVKSNFKNVLKVEVFLTDLSDFKIVNEIYKECFSHDLLPARQVIQVSRLPMDAKIEISCIAKNS